MVDVSSSTTAFVPFHTPTVLTRIDSPHNLVVLNVNAQASLKLTTTNYSVWRLQFTYLLFGYDLLRFVDGSKSCPSASITLPDVASPSLNLDYTLWLRQDQLLINVIIGSISPTHVQFLSTSTTSWVAWTILEKTYASPSRGCIKVHCQNLAIP